MNKRFFGLTLLVLVSTFGLKFTSAFFSDGALSSTNTFSAAEVFPTGIPTPTPTVSITPTPVNIASHLVISEVQIDGGPGNADKDFIELYNPTNSSIDLLGYRLIKRSGNSSSDDLIKSWTTSTIVPSHGYYLWANGSIPSYPSSISADTETNDDLTNSSTVALRNGPNDTGVLIDAVSWTSPSTLAEGTAITSAPGDNQSVERKAYTTSTATSMITGSDISKGNGYDSNNNSTDFLLRTLSQPQNTSSPTETP